MLLVSNFNAALVLPFFILSLILLGNSTILFIQLLSLKDFYIVLSFMSNSVSSHFFNKSNLLFKVSNWSFNFEFLGGFLSNKFGMTMITLNATSSYSSTELFQVWAGKEAGSKHAFFFFSLLSFITYQ